MTNYRPCLNPPSNHSNNAPPPPSSAPSCDPRLTCTSLPSIAPLPAPSSWLPAAPPFATASGCAWPPAGNTQGKGEAKLKGRSAAAAQSGAPKKPQLHPPPNSPRLGNASPQVPLLQRSPSAASARSARLPPPQSTAVGFLPCQRCAQSGQGGKGRKRQTESCIKRTNEGARLRIAHQCKALHPAPLPGSMIALAELLTPSPTNWETLTSLFRFQQQRRAGGTASS